MTLVNFSHGLCLPAIGQGSWKMGEAAHQRREEVAALQAGIDAGLALIDTAEMYADGEAERVVGEAIRGRRDRVFLVSKVYPWHAAGKRPLPPVRPACAVLILTCSIFTCCTGAASFRLKRLLPRCKS